MAGERRKRQQRVRHEAGGSTGQAADGHPHPDAPSSAVGGGGGLSSGASSNNAPTASAAVMARPAKQAAGGGAGRGRGGAKPGGGRRGGVAVATVDEKLYYQPVTIMESKGSTPADELDEAPRQYRRRGIVSNWSRYEERNPALDELEDGRDYLIGEDFSAVLQQQSQGSGGGGHLRLRGEETWIFGDVGSVFRQEGGQQHGLGALRVTDLANTIATIPFMEQLGLVENRLPKQLAEYYNQLAEDNRRLYNPFEDPANVADTAELLEEQLQRLRLAFFDSSSSPTSSNSGDCPSVSKDVSKKRLTRASDAASKEAGSDRRPVGERTNQGSYAEGGTIDDFDDSFASSVDFNSLEKDLNGEISQEPSVEIKVDLTEEMCRAFGSDINEVGDDFGGFVVDVEGESTEEPRGATAAFSVAQSDLDKLPMRDGNDTVKSSVNSNVPINETNQVLLTSESKSKTKADIARDKENVSTQPAQDNVPQAVSCKDLSPELDFSSGNPSFSFGLPKHDKSSRNLMSSLTYNLQTASKAVQARKEEDIDIFIPSEDKSKPPVMSVKNQPVIDLDAPIVAIPVSLVTSKENTKELEDWLDSVLDD